MNGCSDCFFWKDKPLREGIILLIGNIFRKNRLRKLIWRTLAIRTNSLIRTLAFVEDIKITLANAYQTEAGEIAELDRAGSVLYVQNHEVELRKIIDKTQKEICAITESVRLRFIVS